MPEAPAMSTRIGAQARRGFEGDRDADQRTRDRAGRLGLFGQTLEVLLDETGHGRVTVRWLPVMPWAGSNVTAAVDLDALGARAEAGEDVRERHREAGGVRGAEQFLRRGDVGAALGARLPGHRELAPRGTSRG